MFPSLLEEGAAKPQGESPARQEGLSAPGPLEEGGGQTGGIGQLVLVLGENSDGVCGIRDSSKAANKTPTKTPDGSIFQSSSLPEVIASDPRDVRHGVKRVSRRNPWVLPSGSEECLDLSRSRPL